MKMTLPFFNSRRSLLTNSAGFVACLFLGITAISRAETGGGPRFVNATVNGTALTVTVTNFTNRPLVVTFNGALQSGVTFDPVQQIITVPNIAPAVPPPGTYRLLLGKGDDSSVNADVTIGAVGLQGAPGPVGPTGPVGPPGPNDTLAVTPRANMVWIRSGSFVMGSPVFEVDRAADEGPQTAVTITRGFWMGIHEVTQGEYLAVTGRNPSHFTGDTNLPVEQVSWQNASDYCAMLTAAEIANGHIPTNSGWAYRLPTEAEWEYAARAGTATRFSYGDDLGYANLGNYAWIVGNSAISTHPVGGLAPNAWGLFDMYGNVWEWCLDWYGPYSGGSKLDPRGPATGFDYVVRGGGWLDVGNYCRSATRLNLAPGAYAKAIGFRVVLTPNP